MVSSKRLEVVIHHCPECNKKLRPRQLECEYCGSYLTWSEKQAGLHIRIDVTGDRSKRIDDETGKPIAYVTGHNGNTLKTLSICANTLNGNGQRIEAEKMKQRVFEAQSWSEAIEIMNEYVILA